MNSPAAVPIRPKRISRTNRRTPRQPPPPPFRALIAYADVPAARRAISEIHEVLVASGRSYQFCPMLWRFDQLDRPNWNEVALHDATEAAIVVLASTEPTTLPASLEWWVSTLLGRQQQRPVTIVAVLGAAEAWTISIEKSQPNGKAHGNERVPATTLRHVVSASPAFAA